MTNRVILAFILLLASVVVSAEAVIVESRSNHAVRIASVGDREQAIRTLAGSDDSAGLVRTLEAVGVDGSIQPAVRDYLLETALLALSGTTPDADSRAAVQRFSTAPVTTFIRLTDEHGAAVVPLYDLAAAARLTLRSWDRAQVAARTAAALHSHSWQAADFLLPAAEFSASAWRGGAVQAFRSVDVRLLASQRQALLQAQRESMEMAPLLIAAAARLHDPELLLAVVDYGGPADARDAVAVASALLAPATAADLLIAASARPELASASILELGKLAGADAGRREWLLERLASPADGASAALALARMSDPDTLSAVANLITGEQPELTKLRAALVLRLSESPAAQTLRKTLAAQPLHSERVSEALR